MTSSTCDGCISCHVFGSSIVVIKSQDAEKEFVESLESLERVKDTGWFFIFGKRP